MNTQNPGGISLLKDASVEILEGDQPSFGYAGGEIDLGKMVISDLRSSEAKNRCGRLVLWWLLSSKKNCVSIYSMRA